ncbi:MAG: T9SS type A sorting domain-containing protein [Bacteroidia bacterium]|nr:T9SS type A sorting domain-containing protein [Bacteroidia bacterium]
MRKFTLGAVALIVLCIHQQSIAATISSANGGGSWHVAGSWSPAQVPTSADSVVITAGNPISTSAYAYCKSLSILAGATLTKGSTFNIVNHLDVDGTYTGLGNTNFTGVSTVQGAAVISATGHYVFFNNATILAGTVINAPGGIRLYGTGTVRNFGSITLYSETLGITAGTTFVNEAGSTCVIGRNFNSIAGTLDCSAVPNTFEYRGVYVGQVQPATTNYNNLTFSGGGGKTLMGNVVVTGTTTINGSTSLNGNGFTFTTSGNWVNNSGVANLTSFDIIFNSAGTQTIFKPITETFRDMTCSGTGTVLFNTHVRLTDDLTINSGTLDVNTYPYSFYIQGDWQNNGGVFNPRTGAVRFEGTGAQTLNRLVGTEVFYNFQRYNTGTLTLTSNISVGRDVTITAGTMACSGSQFLFVTRNWVNSGGTFSPATSTIFFQGTGSVSVGKTVAGTETFHSIIKSTTTTMTLTSSISCTGNFTHSAGTLDVSASNYNISVAGFIAMNSTFNARSGKVTMNGSGAQILTAGLDHTFYDFEVANTGPGVTLAAGNHTISNSYIPTSGNMSTSGGTSFTWPSSAFKHAIIAGGPGTFTGTGYVMNRYISPRAANWVDLATPVSGTTLADWDNEIYMSAVGGPDGTACCPTFYSVTQWDEPSGDWVNITTTATALDPDQGYTLFLGDDLVDWFGTSVINVTGTPVSGTQPISLSYTGASPDPGGNVVGNGQNAFVDWSTILAASPGVDASFYIYDNTGNYITYGAGDMIAPHQGFWVYATGSGQTLNITQSSKSPSTASTWYRVANIHDLSIKISSELNSFSHEIFVDLDENATNGYDNGLDARFVKSPNKVAPNLTMVHQGNLLLVKNAFAPIEDVVVIPVRAKVGADGIYTLSINGASNIDEYSCVLIKDLVTGKVHDLRETPVFKVTIGMNEDPDRFLLYFIREQNACEDALNKTVDNTFFNDGQVLLLNDGKSASLQFSLDPNTPVQISVYDAVGELISSVTEVVGEQTLPISIPETNGIYLISVTVHGQTVTHKAVINK